MSKQKITQRPSHPESPHLPPRLAELFALLLAQRGEEFAAAGDLKEEFHDIASSKGPFRAKLWYWFQVFILFPVFVKNSFTWSFIMFRNNLKIALRILKRHKGYSFINIAGLTVGMACFFLMMFYVNHELSFDKFHTKYNNLYRVIRTYPENSDIPFKSIAPTPAPLAPTMLMEFPEVAAATCIGDVTGTIRHANKTFSEEGLYADSQFLTLFSFDLLKGERRSCLQHPFSIVLTQKLVRKYFPAEDPIGAVINFSKQKNVHQTGSKNDLYDLTVTGVVADPPPNSHLQFDYLISLDTKASTPGNRDMLQNWGRSQYHSYVELIPGTLHTGLHERLAEYSPRFRGNDIAKYILQPLQKLHWEPISFNLGTTTTNSAKNLYIFSLIAFFILILACINYMNLTTARFSQRTREIGLRKVVGAQKSQLIRQFMGESVLFSLIAACLAVLLTSLTLPSFSFLVNRDINLHWFANPLIPLIAAAMVLFVGLFSGSYPALFLSSFRPIAILKGISEGATGGKGLRNVLVVFQFTVAVCFIIGTLIVAQQLRYIRHKDIGYDREHVIVMPLRDDLARKNGSILSDELRRHPNILAVSNSEYVPLERNNIATLINKESTDESKSINAFTCENGYEFIDVFKLQLLAGRNFSPEFRTDEREAVLLNQTAIKALGLKDPIGKVIDNRGRYVIGVIKDFHHTSLHDKIEPMVFTLRPKAYAFLAARIDPSDIPATLGFMKKAVKKNSPSFAFEYYFQDDFFNDKYQSDQRFGTAFGYASGLAIMIACLGILGLISFATERRSKEIAIRKVLGASVHSILGYLSKEFLLLVALANLLAWPVAYYAMLTWLQNFTFRTAISIWTFLLAAGLSLTIAVLSVLYKSLKTATANPVDSLRYE